MGTPWHRFGPDNSFPPRGGLVQGWKSEWSWWWGCWGPLCPCDKKIRQKHMRSLGSWGSAHAIVVKFPLSTMSNDFFCFFCNRRTSYKFLTRESPEKMKFLTSKKTNFCRVLGLTGKKSHLFCAILGYDTSESLTSRFVSLFRKKKDSKKKTCKKIFFFFRS